MLASVLIRQFFILKHKGVWNWWYPGAGVALLLGVAVWIAPQPRGASAAAKPAVLADVRPIIERRCAMCHNAQLANKNIRLDSAQAIRANAQLVYQQAVLSRTMPLNNATGMLIEERAALARWIEAGAQP